MEKKRWSLILMALCLALAFSVSSVEAQKNCDEDGDLYVKDTNKCNKLLEPLTTIYQGIDCDDTVWSDVNDCEPPPPSPPADFPIIAFVSNNSGSGGAVGHITSEVLLGISTNVSVSKFNRFNPSDLRKRYDVLHFAYTSPRSIDANWPKLLAFMELGGGILFEDPANVEDMEPQVGIMGTQRHVPGDEPTIVNFFGPPELSDFAELQTPGKFGSNDSGSFIEGTVDNCADDLEDPPFFIGPKRGLGWGCLVNNHIIFAAGQSTGLLPWLKLVSDGAVVALYGEFMGPGGTGRIIIQGTDHGYHAGGGYGDFQDNHFCLLTNEIIWLSGLPVSSGTLAQLAIEDCVDNSQARRALIGGGD